MHLVGTSVPPDPATDEKARARYGDLHATTPPPQVRNADDFIDRFGQWLFDTGKQVLQRDGGHHNFIWTVGTSGTLLHRAEHESREELMLIVERLAEESARSGGWGVAIVGELWMAPFDRSNPKRGATESPERTEAFGVSVALADGRVRAFIAPFSRTGGRITFADQFVGAAAGAFDLEPFRRAWRLQRQSGTGQPE